MIFKWRSGVFLIWIFVNDVVLSADAQEDPGESVKNFGEQIGLALLDGFLQKGQEEVARQALRKQIQLLEETNPSYAQILKQIPPEQLISTALAQRQLYAPDTGNPFLNVLAKNGIIVTSNVAEKSSNLNQTQQQQVGNIFQSILRNILQSVQPSIIQNSLFGPHLPTQEITNPLAPNANQLVIPRGGSLIPNPQAFLGSLQGPVVTKPPQVAGVDAPPNPFAKGSFDLGTITIPPQLLTFTTVAITTPRLTEATEADEEETTEVTEYDGSSEATEKPTDSREKKLEDINNRALKVLALRKLRFGSDRTEKPFVKQGQNSKQVPQPKQTPKAQQRIVRPVKLVPENSQKEIKETVDDTKQDSDEQVQNPKQVPHTQRSVRPVKLVPENPQEEIEETSDDSKPDNTAEPLPSVAGINTKNFALISENTKTHSQFQGRTKFSGVQENGRAFQLPIEGVPRAGLGRKNIDDTLLNGKISLPKNWLSGEELSADGSFSRRWNYGIFAGGDLPDAQQHQPVFTDK